jgi:hypothetical protein
MEKTKQSSAVSGVRAGRNRKTKDAGRGTQLLSKAAEREIKENIGTIANLLLNSTLGGNVNSARLLVALADGQTETAVGTKKRRGLSQAQKLGKEQEWRESREKNDAEEAHDETEVACR